MECSPSTRVDNDAGRSIGHQPRRPMAIAANAFIRDGARFRPLRLLCLCGALLVALGLVTGLITGWRSAAIDLTGTLVLLDVLVVAIILRDIKRPNDLESVEPAGAEAVQKVQLAAALDNMRQGLQMYDATGRVILTNQK